MSDQHLGGIPRSVARALTALIRFVIWLLDLLGMIEHVDPDDDDFDPARAADDVGFTAIVLVALPGLFVLLLFLLMVVV